MDREARGHTGTLDCRCHAPQYHSHAQYNHCTHARHRRPRNRRRQRQGELHPRQARAGPCPGPHLCQLQGEGRHVAKRLRRKVRGARQLGWSTKLEGMYEPNGSLQSFFRVSRGEEDVARGRSGVFAVRCVLLRTKEGAPRGGLPVVCHSIRRVSQTSLGERAGHGDNSERN